MAMAPSASAAGFEWNSVSKDAWAIGRDLCAVGKGLLSNGGAPYGIVCFQPDGDKLNVMDNATDGQRVGMQWKSGSRSGMCVNAQGKGAGGTVDAFDAVMIGTHGCNKDLPESATITFRVVRCDASRSDCGVLSSWHDPSSWKSWKVSG